MILDDKRLGRIAAILAEMTREAHEEENVRKDAAAFFKSLRRLEGGGAELCANKDAIKVLTQLIEGRMSSQGSKVDIPASVKNFKRDPGTFMKYLMAMNPAKLAAQGLSRAAWLFSGDSFALGLVLLTLLEEKVSAPKTRPGKAKGPNSPTDAADGVMRKRGRPPKNKTAPQGVDPSGALVIVKRKRGRPPKQP
ncbi:MAG: hypothetical protein JXA24_06745, partial [Proteobacteria bacterium]|nr:hypothetical protein [Pseudomonadota bacterium]